MKNHNENDLGRRTPLRTRRRPMPKTEGILFFYFRGEALGPPHKPSSRVTRSAIWRLKHALLAPKSCQCLKARIAATAITMIMTTAMLYLML